MTAVIKNNQVQLEDLLISYLKLTIW